MNPRNIAIAAVVGAILALWITLNQAASEAQSWMGRSDPLICSLYSQHPRLYFAGRGLTLEGCSLLVQKRILEVGVEEALRGAAIGVFVLLVFAGWNNTQRIQFHFFFRLKKKRDFVWLLQGAVNAFVGLSIGVAALCIMSVTTSDFRTIFGSPSGVLAITLTGPIALLLALIVTSFVHSKPLIWQNITDAEDGWRAPRKRFCAMLALICILLATPLIFNATIHACFRLIKFEHAWTALPQISRTSCEQINTAVSCIADNIFISTLLLCMFTYFVTYGFFIRRPFPSLYNSGALITTMIMATLHLLYSPFLLVDGHSLLNSGLDITCLPLVENITVSASLLPLIIAGLVLARYRRNRSTCLQHRGTAQ